MTWMTTLWFVAGLLTGALHVLLLWRSAQPPFRTAAAALLRLLSVAALLVGAALLGGLFPAACGWGGGFLITTVATVSGRRHEPH